MIARAGNVLVAAFVFAGTLGVAPGLAPCAGVAQAQGTRHAGLVVQFERKPARTYCVEFTEDSISGLQLIERTGLQVALQDYGGGNIAVCAIDGEGCDYPRASCWCRCADLNDCTIWGFYRLDARGAWTFSQKGAAITEVRDGDVHGWRFAKSTPTGGAPPDATTLQKVCATGTRIQAGGVAARASERARAPWAPLIVLAIVMGALAVLAMRERRRRQQQ